MRSVDRPTTRPRALARTVGAVLLLAAVGVGCGDDPEARPSAPPVGTLVEVARSDGHMWSGLAVTPDGSIFVAYPRWFGAHRWSVARIRPNGQKGPFPGASTNQWKPGKTTPPGPDHAWVCVHAVRTDGESLWALDAGNPNFSGILGPAAKLTHFSLRTGSLLKRIGFYRTSVEQTSYLRDLRIDKARNRAYVSDSALGALAVLDLGSERQRHRLRDHPSTKAEDGVVPVVEGRELRAAKSDGASGAPALPMRIHVNGLALDPTGTWLYWQALTARTLYRIPTAILADLDAPEAQVEAAVERVGTTVVADGLEFGPDGTLYLAAIEEDAIVARRPDGTLDRLVSDPRLAWPASLAIGPEGALYVTTAQTHRTPLVDGVTRLPRTPYLLFKTGLPARPAQGTSAPPR